MGRFEKDFEAWLVKNEICVIIFSDGEYTVLFDHNPLSMQWGVYVDFFDENGIYITDGSGRFTLSDRYYYWALEVHGERGQMEDNTTSKNRQEARKTALEKAIEIYNSKNTQRHER